MTDVNTPVPNDELAERIATRIVRQLHLRNDSRGAFDAAVGVVEVEVSDLLATLAQERERRERAEKILAQEIRWFLSEEQNTEVDWLGHVQSAIGTEQDLMKAIGIFRPKYCYGNSPAEIVGDLANEIEEKEARIAELESALQSSEEERKRAEGDARNLRNRLLEMNSVAPVQSAGVQESVAPQLSPGYILRDGETFEHDVLPIRSRAKFAQHIDEIRRAARAHGYAIGVHGSLSRDIDLIAAPWVDEVSDGETLAAAIAGAVGGVIDMGSVPGRGSADDHRKPAAKPHGRMCWSIHLGGGPYIDLAVMPRLQYSEQENTRLNKARLLGEAARIDGEPITANPYGQFDHERDDSPEASIAAEWEYGWRHQNCIESHRADEWHSIASGDWPPMFKPFLARTELVVHGEQSYGFAALIVNDCGTLYLADGDDGEEYGWKIQDGAFTMWKPLPDPATMKSHRQSLGKERRLANLGRDFLGTIRKDRFFFESEQSETWCELLAKHGYVSRMAYDPEKHREIDAAEPGQEVWIFSESMKAAADGADIRIASSPILTDEAAANAARDIANLSVFALESPARILTIIKSHRQEVS